MHRESFILDQTRSYFAAITDILGRIPSESLTRAIIRLDGARWKDQTVFTCGNGGSAATAIHLACDLAKGASVPGKPDIRTLSLCENVSLLTAWANDSSYDDVFVGRMAPWLKPGDLLVAISASGNSRNVLNAALHASAAGATTIGLVGFEGGRLKELVDICVTVPSNNMEQIEDIHLLLCHLITSSLRNLPVTLPTLGRSDIRSI